MRIKKFDPYLEIFLKKFFLSDNQILDTRFPVLPKNIFFECSPCFYAPLSFITHI